jgi:alanine racemase
MVTATIETATDVIGRAHAARAVLEVDLAALRHNVNLIERIADAAKVTAVVKGDAYGLGATVVAPALQSWGVPAFAVDNVAEGIELRNAGIEKPVLIIDGDVPDNAPLAVTHELMPGIAHEHLLDAYEAAAASKSRKHPVWLVANVGFNRSGYRSLDAFESFVRKARECRHLDVKCLYAHLTNSNSDTEITRAQIEEFEILSRLARQVLGQEVEISLFASHGTLRWAQSFRTDWVRPGLLLYGEHNFTDERLDRSVADLLKQFQPVVSLKARIIQLLDFSSAEGVGYGQHHKTKANQQLATVALGFGGGYPSPPRNAYALVNGHRATAFGDIGMDALQLDVTGVPNVSLYDWATLIGSSGAERFTVSELARAAQISPYELLRKLRCYRSYINREIVAS